MCSSSNQHAGMLSILSLPQNKHPFSILILIPVIIPTATTEAIPVHIPIIRSVFFSSKVLDTVTCEEILSTPLISATMAGNWAKGKLTAIQDSRVAAGTSLFWVATVESTRSFLTLSLR